MCQLLGWLAVLAPFRLNQVQATCKGSKSSIRGCNLDCPMYSHLILLAYKLIGSQIVSIVTCKSELLAD